MTTFTSEALKLAYAIQRKIESLKAKLEKHTNKLATVLGGEIPSPFKKGKNKMSAAGRARIAAAQRARWAKVEGKVGGKTVKKGKRKMSAAAKAKISAAAKLRWKKAKAAGKNRL